MVSLTTTSIDHGRVGKALPHSGKSYLHTGPTIIVAATNHTQTLDSALWRRFDIVAEFPLPTPDEAAGILREFIPADLITEKILGQLNGLPHAAVERVGQEAVREAIPGARDEPEEKDVAAALAGVVGRPWG